ncbi:hypothetical protein LOSG293_140120 [Secundilactobacillus oryzae JCM 18671]|uniref:Uncharacterized protein n=1 Tax=Secundilactobacillus oryzae JCM 18671 TaxID=1291743 RepID=A0A081BIK5_9LACO|nr:hypothetical protein LOSG293_140120 [Secundilactobacillus oryzae JCM 18671]
MLAQAAMPVVFVLGEKISRGIQFIGLRQEKELRLRLCLIIFESATATMTLLETATVERGKPLERATQTTVGALHIWK